MFATVAVLSNGRQKDDTKEHVHRESPLTSCVLFPKYVFAPDSLKGYWVSPVKMIPKLPGITRHSTYYSTTEKVLHRMVQDDG